MKNYAIVLLKIFLVLQFIFLNSIYASAMPEPFLAFLFPRTYAF